MKTFLQFQESRYPSTPEEDERSRHAEEGNKEIHAIMRSKGFKHSSHKQSALVHHVYVRDNEKVETSGWHGTGHGNRDYGGVKTLMHAYHTKDTKNPGKYHKIHDGADQLLQKKITQKHVDSHKAGIEKIKDYLRKNIS